MKAITLISLLCCAGCHPHTPWVTTDLRSSSTQYSIKEAFYEGKAIDLQLIKGSESIKLYLIAKSGSFPKAPLLFDGQPLSSILLSCDLIQCHADSQEEILFMLEEKRPFTLSIGPLIENIDSALFPTSFMHKKCGSILPKVKLDLEK